MQKLFINVKKQNACSVMQVNVSVFEKNKIAHIKLIDPKLTTVLSLRPQLHCQYPQILFHGNGRSPHRFRRRCKSKRIDGNLLIRLIIRRIRDHRHAFPR